MLHMTAILGFFTNYNRLKPSGSFVKHGWFSGDAEILRTGGSLVLIFPNSQNQWLLPEIKETPHPASPTLVRTGGEANRQFDMCRDTNFAAQSVSSTRAQQRKFYV